MTSVDQDIEYFKDDIFYDLNSDINDLINSKIPTLMCGARFVDYLIKRNILGFNTVNQKVN